VRVSTSKEPERIQAMFDAIARRYDTLNHLLSAGLDRRWRTRAVAALALTGRERVLDLCTGTGDLALGMVRPGRPGARAVVGMDFAAEMLRVAQRKIQRSGAGGRVTLVRGDATSLPCPDGAFDAATIAYGIRNVVDTLAACRELHRVIRPGGRLVILEFGQPRIPGVKTAYRWYFQYLLPRVGRAISKHGEAYSYLPASVNAFPAGAAFSALLHQAGFVSVQHVSMTLGISYMYVAEKAPYTG
jgi:demethylmenaquinone methyltransferase/2-methoxy-6-polyprenyl-1,4-benzoquinol methylase